MHLPNPLLSLLLIAVPASLQHAVGTPSTQRPGGIDSQRALVEGESVNFFSETNLDPSAQVYDIPSRYESTVLARRLLAMSTIGTLATSFPTNLSSPAYTRTPRSVAELPMVLPEYVADCEEPSGNPTFIALDVSTSTKNIVAGSNVSLSLSWWDEYIKLVGKEPWSQANLPRLSLLGYTEVIDNEEAVEKGIERCFQETHRDSRLWLPGRKGTVHTGKWMRLVVREVYWIGGFGDRNFIGWLNSEEWRGVEKGKWKKVRLPGEKR